MNVFICKGISRGRMSCLFIMLLLVLKKDKKELWKVSRSKKKICMVIEAKHGRSIKALQSVKIPDKDIYAVTYEFVAYNKLVSDENYRNVNIIEDRIGCYLREKKDELKNNFIDCFFDTEYIHRMLYRTLYILDY